MRFGKNMSHIGLKYQMFLIKSDYNVDIAANLQSFAAILLAYKINNVYLGVPASRGVSLIQMNPKFL